MEDPQVTDLGNQVANVKICNFKPHCEGGCAHKCPCCDHKAMMVAIPEGPIRQKTAEESFCMDGINDCCCSSSRCLGCSCCFQKRVHGGTTANLIRKQITRKYKTKVVINNNEHTLICDAKQILEFFTKLKIPEQRKYTISKGKTSLVFICSLSLEKFPGMEEREHLQVAVKKVKIPRYKQLPDKAVRQVIEESAKAQPLIHDYIVRFYAAVIYNNEYMLVLEKCTHSLRELVRKADRKNTVFPLPVIGRIFHCLIAALNYLHERGIYHMDVKPSNILYKTKSSMFKLTDFGIASTKITGALTGTRPRPSDAVYISPEFSINPTMVVGSAFDIWAAGIAMAWVSMLTCPIRLAMGNDYGEEVNMAPLAAKLGWLKDTGEGENHAMFDFIPQQCQELADTWMQMVNSQPAVRIRYKGDSTETERKKRMTMNYNGPKDGLIDSPVYKKYAGAVIAGNDSSGTPLDQVVTDFVREVHAYKHQRNVV